MTSPPLLGRHLAGVGVEGRRGLAHPHADGRVADSQGWPAILSSLKSLLETGESLEATRRWPEKL